MEKVKDTIDIIKEDVGGLMGLVKQRKSRGETITFEEQQKEIQVRLLSKHVNIREWELVAMELFRHAIDPDSEIKLEAMIGLLELDSNIHSETVRRRVINMALFVAEDSEKKPADVARVLLQRHIDDRDYAFPINRVLNNVTV